MMRAQSERARSTRRLAIVLVWTLPSALFLAVTAITYGAYRIPPPERLGEDDRAAILGALRAGVERTPAPPARIPDLATDTPIAVTVWSAGRVIARLDDTAGSSTTAAVARLADRLRADPQLAKLPAVERERARIQVDVVHGHAPLGPDHWLFRRATVPGVADMMAINPGVEGIGVTVGDKTTLVLPHELVATKLVAAKKPSAAFDELAMGVDLDKIRGVMSTRAGVHLTDEPLFRFRTDTFVERAVGQREQGSLPLYRGNTTPQPLTAKLLREHALAGGHYLVAHLSPTPTTVPTAPKGRYVYEHDLSLGTQTDPRSTNYSMPRHAGTTYFLAELYRLTKEAWLREPIERAFAHLAELMANGKCAGTFPDGTAFDCVMDKAERIASLGSTALAVVALAEYQRATGDTRYLPTAQKLAAWILWMQRPDGSFRHRYNPQTKQADDEAMDLYYSGEATLALVRMNVVTHDPRYIAAAERSLDWLVGWYDFFMGGFFYGEEHWTCIAAEAAWPMLQNPDYMHFCHGYGAFLRDQQAGPGEHPDEDDYAGSYGVTPFLAPSNTPAGSRTEAMISAYLLGRHHGEPDAAVRGQIRAALQYAVGQQIDARNDFDVVGPGLGGMPGTPIDRNVRIDYVQHTCSAFIRASEWIDDP